MLKKSKLLIVAALATGLSGAVLATPANSQNSYNGKIYNGSNQVVTLSYKISPNNTRGFYGYVTIPAGGHATIPISLESVQHLLTVTSAETMSGTKYRLREGAQCQITYQKPILTIENFPGLNELACGEYGSAR